MYSKFFNDYSHRGSRAKWFEIKGILSYLGLRYSLILHESASSRLNGGVKLTTLHEDIARRYRGNTH